MVVASYKRFGGKCCLHLQCDKLWTLMWFKEGNESVMWVGCYNP